MAALQSRELAAVWWDKRRWVSAECLVVKVTVPCKIAPLKLTPGNGREYFAVILMVISFTLISLSSAGQSRALSRQRSMVLFSTCHPESVWELCPSRSGGATGSQSAKWMGSTTTSTLNWRVLSASEARPSYGKNVTNTVFSKLFTAPCLRCAPKNWPFVLLELRTGDWVMPNERVTWHLPHCLCWNAALKKSAPVHIQIYARACLSLSHLFVFAAYFSASSSLKTWRRCCWLSGGRWRKTALGCTRTTPRSEALGYDNFA